MATAGRKNAARLLGAFVRLKDQTPVRILFKHFGRRRRFRIRNRSLLLNRHGPRAFGIRDCEDFHQLARGDHLPQGFRGLSRLVVVMAGSLSRHDKPMFQFAGWHVIQGIRCDVGRHQHGFRREEPSHPFDHIRLSRRRRTLHDHGQGMLQEPRRAGQVNGQREEVLTGDSHGFDPIHNPAQQVSRFENAFHLEPEFVRHLVEPLVPRLASWLIYVEQETHAAPLSIWTPS